MENKNSLANAWNNFQLEKKNEGVKGDYNKMWSDLSDADKEKYQCVGPKRRRVNIRCSIPSFCKLVNAIPNKDMLVDSPFYSLLKLEGYELDETLLKGVVSVLSLSEHTLMVGGTKHSLHTSDFSYILGIAEGDDKTTIENKKPRDDLVSRFCAESDKNSSVCMLKVKKILQEQKDEADVHRAFVLAALKFVVCAPSRGKLHARYLNYVEDVAGIKRKPWATIAMRELMNGINTYYNPRGITESNLGGSMVFLQLYYLNKLMNIEPQKVLSLDEKGTQRLLKEATQALLKCREEGKEVDSKAATPKRKRSIPLKLQPNSAETANRQNEGVGPSASRRTKSMEANQEPVKEPNSKLGLNVQWGTKRHFSAKRRLKTISVNAEFRAQDLLDASKEKTDGSEEPRKSEDSVGRLMDTRLDDQPLAGWIERVHSPTTVIGPVETSIASDMDSENLPFVKSTPLWHTIESMEAFVKIPQKPHFRPLLEGVKENAREGLAIGTMVTFSTVVDKTYCLRFDNPRKAIEDCLETLVELDRNGFDVKVIRDRLTRLLLFRDKQVALEDQSKGFVEKLEEHKIQETTIDEEVDEIDRQIRQLEENSKRVLLKKEKLTSEIDAMKAAEEAIEKEIREVAAKFDGLAAACF
ncbi:Agenet-like domain-containing protein [Artemisia annua]|uniref:Agenet-like domain-containing protein n=1 Tax=Artemisia annua TaxID=35608 RepID=A0A2U1KVH4_ARTAN|nr:Agenet-like domain-containing protein [Artemisia annua]